MTDPRVTKLAQVLIHYSLGLKRDQLLKITGEVAALPLIEAAYVEAVAVGAYPYIEVRVPNAEEAMLRGGSERQLRYLPPHRAYEFRKIDAYLGIWGSNNTRYLAGIDPGRQAIAHKARHRVMQIFQKRVTAGSLSWCGTQFPTLADAQEANMSLRDYEEFVYKAGHVHRGDPVKHWKKVRAEQARLCRALEKVDQIHLRAEGTDLRLRVGGRKWINCAGEDNFPDGEVFTAPHETSAEGHIRYSFPAVLQGREVEDVRLWFKKGKVVRELAGKNGEFLTAMLDMDRGARFIGEFAIGTNYEIKRFTKNILFDEKIGGTCHIAVGNAYGETGGTNKSGLHWDMVCDLKRGSEITADGKTIYRNGKFVI